MPAKRDKRTGRWFFRTIVRYADGRKERVFGTPGVPGPYQDLSQTKVGAQAAERRAINEAVTGRPTTQISTPLPKTEVVTTIREHAVTFLESYKPGQKASEKREKRRVLNSHLLPFFGDMTTGLRQTDVDTYAQHELDRGMSVKTVNNQPVLSTLIKYVTGEKSKLRFKLDGMVGEIHRRGR